MKTENIRKWLKKNKIFFETIAATLLSIMALIVSCSQNKIAEKQTKLAEIQTEIAKDQLAQQKKLARIQQTAHWGELRNAIWKIFDQYPPSGTKTITSLPQEQQLEFFKRIRIILDSQIKNPVLIEKKQCLGCWRNAVSAAKIYSDILSKTDVSSMQDAIIASANGILKDVGYVWQELILKSDEVSPTGGRPKLEGEKIKDNN